MRWETDLDDSPRQVRLARTSRPPPIPEWSRVPVLMGLGALLAMALWLTGSAAGRLLARWNEGAGDLDLMPLLIPLGEVFLVLGLIAQMFSRRRTSFGLYTVSVLLLVWFGILLLQAVS
jgi:hypothetical protein